jgi:hypothetical protein
MLGLQLRLCSWLLLSRSYLGDQAITTAQLVIGQGEGDVQGTNLYLLTGLAYLPTNVHDGCLLSPAVK